MRLFGAQIGSYSKEVISLASVTYKCPNCGGPLTFDPKKQLFDCDYCRGEFAEAVLIAKDKERETAAEEGEVVYTCPSCGAQLVTDETTAATFCYYCHNPVVLSGRLAREFCPDKVLPFSIDKETVVEKFLAWTKGKKFVPKEFFAKAQIEKISGVYYPYWMADYRGEAHFEGEGINSVSYISGNYQITEHKHYKVVRDAQISYDNVSRSALTKADRKLADGVHPFNMEAVRDFSPAYLSGFFAEKRDITAEEVRPEVQSEIAGYTESMMRTASGYDRLTGETKVKYSEVKYKYCLLPAWVLTYKGAKGKTYYYSMNGQTGQTCGILPIAKGKLLAHSGLIAAVVTTLICIGGWLFI